MISPDVLVALGDTGEAIGNVKPMEVDGEEANKSDSNEKTSVREDLGFLTVASSREIESWLLSLQIRLLWKEGKNSDAFQLSQHAIGNDHGNKNATSQKLTK